ncbi:AAA family ATPase [Devosia sp. WQ 349]|uniref:ATP-binding protein n=1 Tax=Devosia sp. WQ 349K1 TaxID=2800329 RepID=UPI0019080619|nr:YhaN family protein [Devosia sp. WQ 349K1]MBK1792947.1 AAA family ATPase [Devosia sp. WQ 349K1]
MRIERLNLLRYGALDARELAFRPGARLHLVYGANEAGKSSALAAIADLLFGFGRSKPAGFLRDPVTWRVGATLRDSAGTEVSFRRRRGSKNTLLSDDEQEQALRDDLLQPFVGALSRDVFQRAFGLDSARLRAGAHEMLRSEGELGSLLFAAASGLTGLSALRARLNSSADAIFAKRAAKDRTFYQVLERHEEARRLERDTELKSGEWKELLTAIADAETGLQAIRDNRVQTRRQVNQLQRLRQLQPIKAEIDADLAHQATFSDLDALPANFATVLQQRLARHQQALARHALIEQTVARTTAELAAITVEEPLLAHAETILTLFAQSGDFVSKRSDLPRVDAELSEYRGQIAQLTRRLGLSDDETMQRRQPSDAALQLVADLASAGRQLASQRANLLQRASDEATAAAALETERPAAFLADPKPLRDRLAALAPEIRALERRDELTLRAATTARSQREAALRLQPPVSDLDQLAIVAMPTAETLARHQQALTAASEAERLAAEKQRLAAAEIERLAGQLAQADPDRDLPSAESIAAVRQYRDELFVRLRDALLHSSAQLPAEEAGLATSNYERQVRLADQRADAAFADVERVSRLADLKLRFSERQLETRQLADELGRLSVERAAAEADYRAIFVPVGVTPASPREMSVWLAAVGDLLARRHDLLLLEHELAEQDRRDAELAPVLQSLATASGLGADIRMPTASQVRAIEARLAQLSEAWTERRSLDGRRQDSVRRREALKQQLGDLQVQETDWQRQFAEALPGIGLEPTVSVQQAEVAIAGWGQLPPLLHEQNNRERRVLGMQRDIALFETETGQLTRAVAADLIGLPAEVVIARLRERAETARSAHQQRREIALKLAEATDFLAEAAADLASARTALEEGCASLPAGTDLPQVITRLQDRATIVERLSASHQRFAAFAEGHDSSEIDAELANFERVQASIDIDLLEQQDLALIEDLNALSALQSDHRRRREALEHRLGAELAAFQKHAAETEIVAVSRQWVVLTLASTLLAAAMDRQRATHADPLMAAAGTIFASLTHNAFTGLAQDFDETDQPRLRAIRASGERLALEALSEGTSDQLYLALRLAFLEDYATRNEPAPFIGDDLFQTFDDDRTASGLRALAAISPRLQPIMFTHHQSVVDIARSELGSDLDLIRL